VVRAVLFDGEIDLVDGWSRPDPIGFRSNRMVGDD